MTDTPYYLWWSTAHWRDTLGSQYPYGSQPLPLPATLDSTGCGARSRFAGNMLTDVPAQLWTQDDPATIERDVRQAMAAGLTGFAVNWAGTGAAKSDPEQHQLRPPAGHARPGGEPSAERGPHLLPVDQLQELGAEAEHHRHRQRPGPIGNGRSAPDAWLLISWNEITEGTYVVPLQRYGSQSLDTLRAMGRAAGLSGADHAH